MMIYIRAQRRGSTEKKAPHGHSAAPCSHRLLLRAHTASRNPRRRRQGGACQCLLGLAQSLLAGLCSCRRAVCGTRGSSRSRQRADSEAVEGAAPGLEIFQSSSSEESAYGMVREE